MLMCSAGLLEGGAPGRELRRCSAATTTAVGGWPSKKIKNIKKHKKISSPTDSSILFFVFWREGWEESKLIDLVPFQFANYFLEKKPKTQKKG